MRASFRLPFSFLQISLFLFCYGGAQIALARQGLGGALLAGGLFLLSLAYSLRPGGGRGGGRWRARLALRPVGAQRQPLLLALLGLASLWVALPPLFGWQGGGAEGGASLPFAGGRLALHALLLAPWFEEVIFRGFLQRSLMKRIGIVQAILWTSLSFTLLHLPAPHLVLLYLTSLVLGAALWVSGSLWVSVLLHLGCNLTALVVFTLFPEQAQLLPREMSLLLLLLSVAFLGRAFWLACEVRRRGDARKGAAREPGPPSLCPAASGGGGGDG